MRAAWLIALLAVSSPASADVGATAESVANSIFASRGVDEFSEISTDFEPKDLWPLAGCQPELGKGSTKSLVALIYACEKQDSATVRTTLELLFDQQERLVSAWLVIDDEALAPTEIALRTPKLPSKAKIEKAFMEAIEDGSDISLAGLIPLPSEKRLQRLASLADCKPTPMSVNDRQDLSRRILYSCANSALNTGTVVKIGFDEGGRPLGLTMHTVTVSVETTTRTVPVGS